MALESVLPFNENKMAFVYMWECVFESFLILVETPQGQDFFYSFDLVGIFGLSP